MIKFEDKSYLMSKDKKFFQNFNNSQKQKKDYKGRKANFDNKEASSSDYNKEQFYSHIVDLKENIADLKQEINKLRSQNHFLHNQLLKYHDKLSHYFNIQQQQNEKVLKLANQAQKLQLKNQTNAEKQAKSLSKPIKISNKKRWWEFWKDKV